MLDSYLDRLLRCEAAVTQSTEVTQFFTPKDQELHPDYTKNRLGSWPLCCSSVGVCKSLGRTSSLTHRCQLVSCSIMLLLSDDVAEGGVSGGIDGTHQPGGSITNPFVTQSYRCIDSYETKDTKNRAFKVARDEKLDVLIKDPSGEPPSNDSHVLMMHPSFFIYCVYLLFYVIILLYILLFSTSSSGWWLVENESKSLAWFPAPYLELWDGEEDDYPACQLGGVTLQKCFQLLKIEQVSLFSSVNRA